MTVTILVVASVMAFIVVVFGFLIWVRIVEYENWNTELLEQRRDMFRELLRANASLLEARAALTPFVEACERMERDNDTSGRFEDDVDMTGSGLRLGITAGHLRKAKEACHD